MTVSIRRMTLGSGYRYLMSSVAQSDGAGQHRSALTRYYAESGTPPGRFLGAGLAGLADGVGVRVGAQVSEEHLFRMLAKLQDPITGNPLGAPPRNNRSATVNRPLAEGAGKDLGRDAGGPGRAARFPESRVPSAVAGFDLTFSAPKSVSVAWALADPATQAVIYEAHQRALTYVIGYAEGNVFFSRSGKNGIVQEDIRGVVATAFDHWDSRAGDPQLHTHVVIMNRGQCADGVWRALNSRSLFKHTVALSEMYNAVLSDYLTNALGYGWQPQTRKHSTAPKWEIAGVGEQLQAEFSQRSAAIEDTTDTLIDGFRAAHGRSPSSREVLQLRQRATLSTRPDKHVHPLADLVAGWRERAGGILADDPGSWAASLAGRNDLPLLTSGELTDAMLAEVGRVSLDAVAGKRATFGRSNVFAEVLRHLHGIRFASPDDRMETVERTTDLALAGALLISPPDLAHVPDTFRRPDGTSRFRPRGSAIYTTQTLLDAEDRLVAAGRSLDGPRILADTTGTLEVAGSTVALKLTPTLTAEQATAVTHIIGSGRVLDVLVGPAGAGKSTTMAGLRALWEQHHGWGSVVGLAPSAAAAEVLAEQLGVVTENTAKWLTEHARNPERLADFDALQAVIADSGWSKHGVRLRRQCDALRADMHRWSLRAGQLVIVDEASLAATLPLDALVGHAREVGAKVLLVGDWAQLSPVEAGGAFSLLVHDRQGDAPELIDVHRFTHPWERQASVDLRIGKADAVDIYNEHGRIHGGHRDTALNQLFNAWRTDLAAGKRSLMIAADHQTVADLNQRARHHRIATGEVSADGVPTDAGATIGIGDIVVTRRNDRHLSTGTSWVKNGDTWIVTAARTNGSLTVARTSGPRSTGRHVVLPADYVRDHVDLGYATTAHRAQGRTVDTAHAYITATTRREVLYVAATRGRDTNQLYVDTSYEPDADTAHQPAVPQEPAEVLRQVLANPGADVSATHTLTTAWADGHSLTRLWEEYETLAATALRARYRGLLETRAGLSVDEADRVHQSPAYGSLLAALREAEARGYDLSATLPRLVSAHTLSDADDIAAVLHERLNQRTTRTPPTRPARATRIVGLIPAVTAPGDPDLHQALRERQDLITQRTRTLSEQAVREGQRWTLQLGAPPVDPVMRELWLRHVDTIAAYRERWTITDATTALGDPPSATLEQKTQRHLAQQAALEARQVQKLPTRPEPLTRRAPVALSPHAGSGRLGQGAAPSL